MWHYSLFMGCSMIRIPLEQVIDKIKKEGGLSSEELESRIKKKIDQLSGLISREGAAHIICNELGIKMFEQTSGKLSINNILPGMRDVEVAGKIIQIYEVREFQSGERTGKVGSLLIGDASGIVRLVLWGSQTDKIAKLSPGTIIKVSSAYVKENNNRKEIHLSERGELVINPQGVEVGEIKKAEASRKNISDLNDNDGEVELLGTIVQVYDTRFFPVCNQCGKKALQKPDGMVCNTHGNVPESFAYLLSVVLDDGTSNIRAVFFRDQVDALIGKSSDEIKQFRNFPEKFEQAKHDLLGKQIKVAGRAKKNDMFDRTEFMVRQVSTAPSPADELARLQKKPEPQQAAAQPAALSSVIHSAAFNTLQPRSSSVTQTSATKAVDAADDSKSEQLFTVTEEILDESSESEEDDV